MKKIVCLFICLFVGSANAALLSFDSNGSLTDNSAASYQGIGDTYIQSGFTLTVGAGDHFDSMGSNGLHWHDGAANTQIDNYAYLTFSGGLFDLTSFEFNSYSGELMTNLTSLTTYGVGTHIVNLTGLTWAAFSPISSSIYLDNVSVSAASVPEPSFLALLGFGLAGIGFSRKKKVA